MGYFGALSLDITQANATLADDSEHQGQSVRFLYNKSLDETGTNLQLVGYRYSTRGYYNFADTTYRRMSGYSVETQDGVIQVKPKFTDYYNLAYSKRGKVQLSVTQQLGRTATLYLSGSHQTYWGTDDADEQLQAGPQRRRGRYQLVAKLQPDKKRLAAGARSNAGDQYQYPLQPLAAFRQPLGLAARQRQLQPVARSQWPHDQSGGPVWHPAGRQQPQL